MPMIRVERISKTFILHLQGGSRFAALDNISLDVDAGSCVVLQGPSGAGKSTLLKMIYGSYRCETGSILIDDAGERLDIASAAPRRILQARRRTLGYVSQFLRAIPRVSALDLVVEEARASGVGEHSAHGRAQSLLERLNVPTRLWGLAPATFSGGEQQRVNIARGFVADRSILLLDEPTASLDAQNRAAVEDLIRERRERGVAMLAILHDEAIRERVADRIVQMHAPKGEGESHGR